ncbi:hypothetical protein ARMGADRAFT_1038053 [Armillaria gallica]|uniref:Uncharacterized protein n=1 Tax=Armillaria gallica TaxID=47427 RepID=A0A2H3D4L0_ARMGA|nr:hypothetical protein ARMGADRAFT_1038053 [Armillaria gallica]
MENGRRKAEPQQNRVPNIPFFLKRPGQASTTRRYHIHLAELPKKPSELSFQERHVHPEMMKGNRGPENHEKSRSGLSVISRTLQDKKWTQTEVPYDTSTKRISDALSLQNKQASDGYKEARRMNTYFNTRVPSCFPALLQWMTPLWSLSVQVNPSQTKGLTFVIFSGGYTLGRE